MTTRFIKRNITNTNLWQKMKKIMSKRLLNYEKLGLFNHTAGINLKKMKLLDIGLYRCPALEIDCLIGDIALLVIISLPFPTSSFVSLLGNSSHKPCFRLFATI